MQPTCNTDAVRAHEINPKYTFGLGTPIHPESTLGSFAHHPSAVSTENRLDFGCQWPLFTLDRPVSLNIDSFFGVFESSPGDCRRLPGLNRADTRVLSFRHESILNIILIKNVKRALPFSSTSPAAPRSTAANWHISRTTARAGLKQVLLKQASPKRVGRPACTSS